MIHFIKSKTINGLTFTLWQKFHYVYEIDCKKDGKTLKKVVYNDISCEEALNIFDNTGV